MGLKCGIVGLPNVGKSTLLNALSNAKAQSANFPFCTIEPNIGVITVPDDRLIRIQELVQPKNTVPTTIEFMDIAGLVKGASKGEGLGNQFLANIRESDAIIHVVRCFKDPNIVHVHGDVNPLRDKEIVEAELMLKDLETLERRINRISKVAKAGDKEARRDLELLKNCHGHISSGMNARTMDLDKEQKRFVDSLFLLSSKKVLYVCNVDEEGLKENNEIVSGFEKDVANENAEVIVISANLEADIAELESYEDRQEFLADLGLKESGLNRLVNSAYRLLHLITFFTAGPKEVKAWTIREATSAPAAAGAIHSDFERGFIRAEVIHYEDYIKYGSEAACREAGKLHIEGKDYLVLDGDVIYFRFNV